MVTANKNGTTLTIAFSGHIDLIEVKAGQTVIDAIDSKTKTVVFDMEYVDYISSSALRLFLTVRKRFQSNECVQIINCNETVYDTIEATGFQLMMVVSKKIDFDINKASWKDILAYRVANTPDFVFLTYGDRDYTWKELDIYSQIVADDLALKGVKPLSHVGITGANSANFLITFFALQKLGAIAVLINDKLKINEIVSLCKTGDICAICIGNYFTAPISSKLKTTLTEKTEVSFVYDISDDVDFSKRASEYNSIKHLYNETFFSDTPSLMIFSSGSTGTPKAVLLSTYNLICNSISQIDRWGITKNDCLCLSIPLFHIFGFKVGFVYPVIMNNRICIPKDTHTSTVISMIEREKCTLLPLVPTMLLAILSSRTFSAKKIKSIRITILAGAALSEPQMLRTMKLLPDVHFINLYGLSEMTPLSATLYEDSISHICNTAGIPSRDVEVKVVNPANNLPCNNFQQGEILARGINSFLCYYKCPVEFQSIDSEGFVHTGDLGFLDNEGYIHLSGRIKEIIIRGGENILPAEIANAISAFDNVKEVLVIGIPDDFYGEVVGACVSLYDGSLWNEDDLNRFLSDKISDYKIPVKYLLFDELPKLGNGKFDREGMRKLLLAECKKYNT